MTSTNTVAAVQRTYYAAPLPFRGQKRRFARKWAQIAAGCPSETVFVDLFGGSGLLSHIAKRMCPDARVVYNDYDGFASRLGKIPQTNAILSRLRHALADYPKDKRIAGETRERVLDILNEARPDAPDWISLSSSLLFSGRYATCFDELAKGSMYNTARSSDFVADGYLDGLEIVSLDYRILFRQFCDKPEVLFIVDPPYLYTDKGGYNEEYWKLSQHLDITAMIDGRNFVYFTSSKSVVVEMCEWLETSGLGRNPLKGCATYTFDVKINHTASYQDIMLVSPGLTVAD